MTTNHAPLVALPGDGAQPHDSLDEELANYTRRADHARAVERMRVIAWQIVILLVILTAWEVLTRVPWLIKNTIFDPFFLSRPSMIAVNLYDWVWGREERLPVATLVLDGVGDAARPDRLRDDRVPRGTDP